MRSKTYPHDILDQAKDVLTGCKEIDPNLNVGTMTQDAFAEVLTDTRSLQSEIDALEKRMTTIRKQRDDQLSAIWDTVKRTRSTVKGTYGDDSSQYKLVGGTPMSDRKRPARKQPEQVASGHDAGS